jgi:uncharacterized protein (DUF58 family)
MPTVRGWAALGVAAALAALWAAFGEIELVGTAAFLIAAVVFAVVLIRTADPTSVVRRRVFPSRVHEGDRVVVEIELSTARPLGNLILEDRVHGLGVARFAAARSGSHLPLLARYEVACRVRGIYPVGPAEVTLSDPLSLVERRTLVGEPGHLVVFPRVEDLEGFPIVQSEDGSARSTRPSGIALGGEDFFTLREYQVGDDLRRVHWPSSAKRDQLMIKQLDIPWLSRALVLLDQRAEPYPTSEAFEQAVRGAASVVRHLYAGGYRPDLWAGEQAAGLTSSARYTQSMEMLAGIQPVPELDLLAAVGRLSRTTLVGGALVLVTGSPDEAALTVLRALAPRFSRRIVLAVAPSNDPGMAALQAVAAATGRTSPGADWAPAWRSAMELTWSTVSAG